MDRKVLSQRLAGLSSVFSNETKIAKDLRAMAYVLENMPEDKFANIVNPEFAEADKEAVGLGNIGQPLQHTPGVSKMPSSVARREGPSSGRMKTKEDFMAEAANVLSPEVLKKVQTIVMEEEPVGHVPSMAPARLEEATDDPSLINPTVEKPSVSEEEGAKYADGGFWDKAASAAVMNNLIRDVVGMTKTIQQDTKQHLEKGQIPDGTHKATTPPTLKKEQTPDISNVIKSDIVEKSHKTPLRKEAGSQEAGSQEALENNPSEEDEKDKKDACQNEANTSAEELLKGKSKKASDDSSDIIIDSAQNMDIMGIQFDAQLDEAVLDAKEAETLSKLYL